MTPEEKTLIDARRTGFLACWSSIYGPPREVAHFAAAREFPYPPEEKVFTDRDGTQWRFREGAYQWRESSDDEWRWALYSASPDTVRGLYALLPPEKVT